MPLKNKHPSLLQHPPLDGAQVVLQERLRGLTAGSQVEEHAKLAEGPGIMRCRRAVRHAPGLHRGAPDTGVPHGWVLTSPAGMPHSSRMPSTLRMVRETLLKLTRPKSEVPDTDSRTNFETLGLESTGMDWEVMATPGRLPDSPVRLSGVPGAAGILSSPNPISPGGLLHAAARRGIELLE